MVSTPSNLSFRKRAFLADLLKWRKGGKGIQGSSEPTQIYLRAPLSKTVGHYIFVPSPFIAVEATVEVFCLRCTHRYHECRDSI